MIANIVPLPSHATPQSPREITKSIAATKTAIPQEKVGPELAALPGCPC